MAEFKNAPMIENYLPRVLFGHKSTDFSSSAVSASSLIGSCYSALDTVVCLATGS
jgi:hypothetical protein